MTWEKSFKQDYGVDLNILNNRLKATFDYYKEHRTDILVRSGIAPGLLGFTLPAANLGEVDSWGYELSLKWNDKIGKNVTYWVEGNLSYNQNEIKELYDNRRTIPGWSRRVIVSVTSDSQVLGIL